ncbi:DivIVA domain-containing protein [Plantactinospora siamensis]|uniref:DivIVA domain-containing protein n=1 Tax=Plantactinospora siamensis TaxID=555372 RepID=A0ABV6NVE8_9ACTN
MGQLLLILVAAVTVAAVVFGVAVLVTGGDPGLAPAEPDGRSVPLPSSRPLREGDIGDVRFDTAVRGYRMGQVDDAMRRAAYDIGYKDELISVLEAEVAALRDGRTDDADSLRRSRELALAAAAPVDRETAAGAAADEAPEDVAGGAARPVTGRDGDRPEGEPALVAAGTQPAAAVATADPDAPTRPVGTADPDAGSGAVGTDPDASTRAVGAAAPDASARPVGSAVPMGNVVPTDGPASEAGAVGTIPPDTPARSERA